MTHPLCIFCRRPVTPHKPETCLAIVRIERDWALVKGGARSDR